MPLPRSRPPPGKMFQQRPLMCLSRDLELVCLVRGQTFSTHQVGVNPRSFREAIRRNFRRQREHPPSEMKTRLLFQPVQTQRWKF
jgi:hypothetical protein